MRALLPCLLLLASGCGPWGPLGVIPGGPFVGPEIEERIDDWSFTDAFPLIGVETRGRFFRHSVTVLCLSAHGEFYLMARHGGRKRWVAELMADPRIRVEIDGRIYPARATRVTEPFPDARVGRAFLRKYVGIEAERVVSHPETPGEGDDRAEVWTFRVVSDPAS